MTQDKVEMISWIASYPKSGNTWLRTMLSAYRNGGFVDINQLSLMGMADTHAQYLRFVSPLDITNLGLRGQQLLRPAMLMHQVCVWPVRPMFVKTHNANVIPQNMGPLIPPDLTARAIYIVRDPRDVFLSVAPYLNVDRDTMIKNFANDRYYIGVENMDLTTASQICSWSTHVKSWTQEQVFPVLILRYEDIMEDPAGALCATLDFCGEDVDELRARKAADACQLDKLRQQEEDHGFRENQADHVDRFFHKGGSRWKQELEYKYVRQIEKDHSEMMDEMGYEMADAAGLEAVL